MMDKKQSFVNNQISEKYKKLTLLKSLLTPRRLFSKDRSPNSPSQSSSLAYEGGSDDEELAAQQQQNYTDEQLDYGEEDDIDPGDPYQINRINEIPHEHLKELYTQVVDELLDIQLEFEDKLAEAEENTVQELEKQKVELEQEHQKKIDDLNGDLEKHKVAIAKLSEKLQKNHEALQRARQQNATSQPQAANVVNSDEYQKLQEKLEQLQDDYNIEKAQALKLEDQFDKYKQKMQQQEVQFKENQKQLAKIEIENDELKNDIRQMEFMVEDSEQKLDSQLEINELLNTESDEMRQHLEEQIERLRQQLSDNQAELMVKEKEIKKIKFNQLIIDTQATFQNITAQANKNLNHTVRHNTQYQKSKNKQGFFDMDNKSDGAPQQNQDQQQSVSPAPKAATSNEVQSPEKAPAQQQEDQEAVEITDNNRKPRNSKTSLQSGEFENTSEKSAGSQSNNQQINSGVISQGALNKTGRSGSNNQDATNNFDKARPPQAAPAPVGSGVQQTFDFNLEELGEEIDGVNDLEIENLDEILECGDDLMDIEQTAFMGSSKIMLKMIDNMLSTIDSRIEAVQVMN